MLVPGFNLFGGCAMLLFSISRFLLGEGKEFAVFLLRGGPWVAKVLTFLSRDCSVARNSSEEGTQASMSVSAELTSVLLACTREGLRLNISRMLLRPSNSGISLPDCGKISFLEYSLWRIPFKNTPAGFITSSRSTSRPSNCTRFFKMAYTGQ